MFDFSRFNRKTAVRTDKGEELSYVQLKEEITLLSAHLTPDMLIFCLCENSLGCFVGYVSCLQHHIPVAMLDGSKDVDILFGLISVYKPNYLWVSDKRQDIIGNHSVLYQRFGFSLVLLNEQKHFLNSQLILLLATSGSTGSPKFVRLSYENVRSNAESIAGYLDISSEERPVTSLPMHYSYGLSVINSHLLKGATILLTNNPVIQKEFWVFVGEQKATSMAGVPYTYEMLKRLHLFRMDLPYLKTMTQAGGKLNVEIAREFMEQAAVAGKRFVVMYGQTEATARMSYLPWDKAIEKCGSIGIAIPGGKFSIRDSNNEEIDDFDVDGELVYTGPNVSMGYAECSDDLAKGDENHGVLFTGDIGHRDKDGYFYITGRMKRFVKIFGNRVNLDAIEQLIKVITTSCACIGVDDKLTVFTTEKSKEEAIRSLLVKKTGLNACAFSVHVIDAIPKSSSGKIQYAELYQLLD